MTWTLTDPIAWRENQIHCSDGFLHFHFLHVCLDTQRALFLGKSMLRFSMLTTSWVTIEKKKLANHVPPQLVYFDTPQPKILLLDYSRHHFPVQTRPYFCC
jgi:hypothetical protein